MDCRKLQLYFAVRLLRANLVNELPGLLINARESDRSKQMRLIIRNYLRNKTGTDLEKENDIDKLGGDPDRKRSWPQITPS